MVENDFSDVKSYLQDLCDDSTTPKNVKSVIQSIITILDEDSETSIKVNKSLDVLESLSDVHFAWEFG